MWGRIAAAIRAFAAAMRTLVWEWVQVGENWVKRLVAGAALVEPMMAETPAHAAAIESMLDLRAAANVLVQGKDLSLALTKALPSMQVNWLRSMTRTELCKLILTRDDAVRLHLRGIAPIKGIVPYNADAIKDVAAARAERPKPPTVPRRTLRAVLAEREATTLAA